MDRGAASGDRTAVSATGQGDVELRPTASAASGAGHWPLAGAAPSPPSPRSQNSFRGPGGAREVAPAPPEDCAQPAESCANAPGEPDAGGNGGERPHWGAKAESFAQHPGPALREPQRHVRAEAQRAESCASRRAPPSASGEDQRRGRGRQQPAWLSLARHQQQQQQQQQSVQVMEAHSVNAAVPHNTRPAIAAAASSCGPEASTTAGVADNIPRAVLWPHQAPHGYRGPSHQPRDGPESRFSGGPAAGVREEVGATQGLGRVESVAFSVEGETRDVLADLNAPPPANPALVTSPGAFRPAASAAGKPEPGHLAVSLPVPSDAAVRNEAVLGMEASSMVPAAGAGPAHSEAHRQFEWDPEQEQDQAVLSRAESAPGPAPSASSEHPCAGGGQVAEDSERDEAAVLSPMRRTNTRGSEVSGAGARRAPWVAGSLWPDQPGLGGVLQGHTRLALGTEAPATAVGSTLGLPAAPAASDALSVESQMNGDLPAAAGSRAASLSLGLGGGAAAAAATVADTATRAARIPEAQAPPVGPKAGGASAEGAGVEAQEHPVGPTEDGALQVMPWQWTLQSGNPIKALADVPNPRGGPRAHVVVPSPWAQAPMLSPDPLQLSTDRLLGPGQRTVSGHPLASTAGAVVAAAAAEGAGAGPARPALPGLGLGFGLGIGAGMGSGQLPHDSVVARALPSTRSRVQGSPQAELSGRGSTEARRRGSALQQQAQQAPLLPVRQHQQSLFQQHQEQATMALGNATAAATASRASGVQGGAEGGGDEGSVHKAPGAEAVGAHALGAGLALDPRGDIGVKRHWSRVGPEAEGEEGEEEGVESAVRPQAGQRGADGNGAREDAVESIVGREEGAWEEEGEGSIGSIMPESQAPLHADSTSRGSGGGGGKAGRGKRRGSRGHSMRGELGAKQSGPGSAGQSQPQGTPGQNQVPQPKRDPVGRGSPSSSGGPSASASASASAAVRDSDIEALGRCLTGILRHRAPSYGIQVSADGFVAVEDLLGLQTRTRTGRRLSTFSMDEVHKAVETDNKQRFSLKEDGGKWSIRANQGHSIGAVKSEVLLQTISDASQFPVCVHGTYKRHMASIMDQGLRRMSRNHIHFAPGLPTSATVKSGFRSSCEVVIFVDMKLAMTDGIKFLLSDNNVILTEGQDGVLLPKYFSQVVHWPSMKPFTL